VLLPKKLLVLGNETPLRKQEKLQPERESVQLVKNLEEKQKEDLGDENSPLFLFTFDTNFRLRIYKFEFSLEA